MPRELDEASYRRRLEGAHELAAWLCAADFESLLDAIAVAEVTAPILDPTLFIQKGEAMRQDKSVIEILNRAKHDLDRLVEGSRR